MYERYVVASGVNEAKRVLRQSSPYYKDVKFKVVECSDVLVVESKPNEPVKETMKNSTNDTISMKNEFGRTK